MTLVQKRCSSLPCQHNSLCLEPSCSRRRFHKFRLLDYMYPTVGVSTQAAGLFRHTDSTLFTVVFTGPQQALRVYDRAAQTMVTTPPGTVVLMVGWVLDALTDSAFTACLHEVAPPAARRTVVAAFCKRPAINVFRKFCSVRQFLPTYRRSWVFQSWLTTRSRCCGSMPKAAVAPWSLMS